MRCLILVLFLFGCIDECDYECWDGSSVCDLADCPDVCEGYECWDGSCVESENDCVDQPSGEFSIYYESDTPIAGFQFNINSVDIIGASGGSAATAGFTVSTGSNVVIGFSLSGNSIPAGSGLLTEIQFSGNLNDACLSNPIISDNEGNDIPVFIVDCNHLIIGLTVQDFFDHTESNLMAFYYFDQVLIDNQEIDVTDWVAAFNGDICVGAKQWTCNAPPCELPVYGYSSINSLTDGYMLSGELPTFKIYDTSDDILYNAIPSTNIVWEDQDLFDNNIETLTAE